MLHVSAALQNPSANSANPAEPMAVASDPPMKMRLPSIGLEPRFIDMVFEILDDLQRRDGKTIIMVEQNAKKGLAFADIGYVLVSGETAIAGDGDGLLENPDVGRLFLGG